MKLKVDLSAPKALKRFLSRSLRAINCWFCGFFAGWLFVATIGCVKPDEERDQTFDDFFYTDAGFEVGQWIASWAFILLVLYTFYKLF